MTDDAAKSNDAETTPVGVTTICPQCGVMLDAVTTTCGACGAVITGAATELDRADKLHLKLQEAIGEALTLGELLGRGGMGIVFRAREKALDRDVALKVLAFDPLLNPEAYARFEREAKLAARLDHPNIVPIFSVGQRNGVAFYTMRMVKGGSVEQMIVPGRGLDVLRALGILRDVAAALDFAHQNGVVHRDIKPANVLIGDSGHALVADFGIARAFGDAGSTNASSTGIIGSPAYMSPEQWRGEKVDGRADQYALAVLAFELLTGRRPFVDASMQELLRMHLSEDPPDIVSLREDLGAHTTDAIWRAMAKHPDERFPSAMAFVDALGGSIGAAPLPARATPAPIADSRPTPTARMRTTVPPGAGSASSSTVEVPAPPASYRSMWPVAALLLLVGGLGGVIFVQQRDAARAAAVVVAPVSPPTSLNADSVIAAENAQVQENAELRKELADVRRIAFEAEHRAEQLSKERSGRTVAAVKETQHAHLFVMTRGGNPGVIVDGKSVADESPAVIELPPGRHTVQVQGSGVQFFPAQYSIDVTANDTTNLTFISRRVAQQNAARARQRNGAGDGADATAAAASVPPTVAGAPAAGSSVDQGAVSSNGSTLAGANGAAPAGAARTADQSKMTPEQRQRWQNYLRNQALRQAQRRP